ncbi:unnamed protein product, partial [Discosporangium mesarthrocarpum]
MRSLVFAVLAGTWSTGRAFVTGGSGGMMRRSRVSNRATWSLIKMSTPNMSAEEPDQDSTPLVDAMEEAASRIRAPFFFPGHKMGRGAPQRFLDVILGGQVEALRHDLPELPELDNLFAPEGPIRDAELLAEKAFGAAKTWMLANGSTAGVLASIMACVQRHQATGGGGGLGAGKSDPGAGRMDPGQPCSVFILPRDAHKSAVHALVLSGAMPCFIEPWRDARTGVGLGLGLGDIQKALKEHGDKVAGVFVVSPTYEGVCMDLDGVAEACHTAGVPLVVDEAHGAHLSFLTDSTTMTTTQEKVQVSVPRCPPSPPARHLPNGAPGALENGADLVVQSAHKTLGSLTQSAFLHLGGVLLCAGSGPQGGSFGGDFDKLPGFPFSMRQAVSAALATVQSSSPSYLLLASLDAARWSLAGGDKSGRTRLREAAAIALDAKARHSSVLAGLEVLDLGGRARAKAKGGDGAGHSVAMDPLRLTVLLPEGLSGFDVDEMLIDGVHRE